MGGSKPRYSLPGALLLPRSFSVGALTPGHTSPRGSSRSHAVLLLLAILVGLLVISNVTQVWRYHPWQALQHPAGPREVVSFSSTVKVYEPFDQQRHTSAAAAAAEAAAAGMPFRVASGGGKAGQQKKDTVDERGVTGSSSPTAASSKAVNGPKQETVGGVTVGHPGGTPTGSDALRIRSHSETTLDQLRDSVARLATPPPPAAAAAAVTGVTGGDSSSQGAALSGSKGTSTATSSGLPQGAAASSTKQQAGGASSKAGSSSSSGNSTGNSNQPETAGDTQNAGIQPVAAAGMPPPAAAAAGGSKEPAVTASPATAGVAAATAPAAAVPAACPPAATVAGVSPVVVPRVPGVPDSMYQYINSAAGGMISNTTAAAAGQGPVQLKHPLWWFGPVWSGSGYGSEAVNYMLSLLRTGRVAPQHLWASHHGDEQRDSAVSAMAPPDRFELHAMTAMPQQLGKQTGAIVVCHSMPTNWPWPTPMWYSGARCPPQAEEAGWVYVIGRTMFETDRLPRAFVPRINAMNEVWVPSPWQAASFIASGVDPNKVRVVPEGVNTTHYDPSLYQPLALENTAELVFGRSWADKTLSRQQQQQRQQQKEKQPTAAGRRLQKQQQPTLEDSPSAAAEPASPPAAAPAPPASSLPPPPAAAAAASREQVTGAGRSQLPPPSRRPFVFLSTFKWERRKGWDVLLEAYLSEFTSQDDVELYILTKPYGRSGSGFQDMMQDWARDKGLGGARQGQGRAARQLMGYGGDIPGAGELQEAGGEVTEDNHGVSSTSVGTEGAGLIHHQQQRSEVSGLLLDDIPEVSEEELRKWYQQQDPGEVGLAGAAATAELADAPRWGLDDGVEQVGWGMEPSSLAPNLTTTSSSRSSSSGYAPRSSSSSSSSSKGNKDSADSSTWGVEQQVHHIRSWLSNVLLPRLQAAGSVPPHWLGRASQLPTAAARHTAQQHGAEHQQEQIVFSSAAALAVPDAAGGSASRQLLQQPAVAAAAQGDPAAARDAADAARQYSQLKAAATAAGVAQGPAGRKSEQEVPVPVSAHTPAAPSAGAVNSFINASSSTTTTTDASVPSVATLTPSGAVLVTAGGDTSGLLTGVQGGDPTLAAAGAAATAAPAGPEFPTLYVVHRHISDEDFPRIYKAADAFVLPSRGEGWGRPHVEAMSMGLPVIATNWSGVTAYLDESVGYPLPIEDVVPVQAQSDSEYWFRGLKWAQPSVKELRKLMRHVYENRAEAAAKGAAARQRMVEKYSPPAIAEAVVKELQRIERLLG